MNMKHSGQDNLAITIDGPIATIKLDRPEKRNAIADGMIRAIGDFFRDPPKPIRLVVLHGEGKHFCAGLDLSEVLVEVEPLEAINISRLWHAALDAVQYAGLPVICVMHGAVLGGGLEIASAAHVRIAEEGSFFGLPEAQRGVFVGGGASVRVARIIGADRMTEMMLTGRSIEAPEAHQLGLCHYVAAQGSGMTLAMKLAEKIIGGSPLTNFLAIQALSRISTMGAQEGLFTESIAAALPRFSRHSREEVARFLGGRLPKP